MLISKYNGYTFYAHNFSGHDAYFILKIIIKLSNLYPDQYKYNLTMRDDDIIAMKISRKVNTKTYSIKIIDSLNLLQGSLDKLSKTFNTEVKKSVFPYDFINKNKIFYVGKKPDIKYYNISVNEYKENPSEN